MKNTKNRNSNIFILTRTYVTESGSTCIYKKELRLNNGLFGENMGLKIYKKPKNKSK